MVEKNFVEELQKGSVELIVKTNAPKRALVLVDGIWVVFVKAKPENNKANDEIENYLSKLTAKNVKIVRGMTSKKKAVKIK